MKFKTMLIVMCLIAGTNFFATAQTRVDEIVKEWQRAKAYTKEYLDAMPESGYALKPTPEMRSFAEQLLHLADANYGFASAIAGVKSPVGQGESESQPINPNRM